MNSFGCFLCASPLCKVPLVLLTGIGCTHMVLPNDMNPKIRSLVAYSSASGSWIVTMALGVDITSNGSSVPLIVCQTGMSLNLWFLSPALLKDLRAQHQPKLDLFFRQSNLGWGVGSCGGRDSSLHHCPYPPH